MSVCRRHSLAGEIVLACDGTLWSSVSPKSSDRSTFCFFSGLLFSLMSRGDVCVGDWRASNESVTQEPLEGVGDWRARIEPASASNRSSRGQNANRSMQKQAHKHRSGASVLRSLSLGLTWRSDGSKHIHMDCTLYYKAPEGDRSKGFEKDFNTDFHDNYYWKRFRINMYIC